jgi:polyisoprenoid-binding protein YceI
LCELALGINQFKKESMNTKSTLFVALASLVIVAVTLAFGMSDDQAETLICEDHTSLEKPMSIVVDQKETGSCNKIQSEKKYVSFAISHGHCNLGFTGVLANSSVNYENNDLSKLKVNFAVNTKTLCVGGDDINQELTASIQSAEMFDGSGSQLISFKTEDVFVLGENWYQLRGKMTIKGIEKTVRLRATPHLNGSSLVNLVIDGTIDLNEFEIESDTMGGEEAEHIMFMNLVLPANPQDGC